MKIRLRTNYQGEAHPRVVRLADSARIDGVIGMKEGEALGHNMIADSVTLATTALLSNAASGLSSRFGHPGLSENATGKKLARGQDFRVDGDTLRFDMHMSESARISPAFGQDPVEYVLSVAELAPHELGMSYVLSTDLSWVLDDGSERPLTPEERSRHAWGELTTPEDSAHEHPVMRPTDVYFVDIVNEGALTSDTGMLSATELFSGRSSEYLAELFDIVDRWRSRYHINMNELDVKIEHILSEYKVSRGDPKMAKKRAEPVTLESDDPFAPDVAVEDEPEEESIDDLSADVDAALSEIAEDEKAESETLTVVLHLQQQVALALGSIEKLKADNERMKKLMRDMLNGVEALSRNQRRLAGEPVVTQSVPTARRDDLEPVQYEHPTPPEGIAQGRTGAAQRRGKTNIANANNRMKTFGIPGGI